MKIVYNISKWQLITLWFFGVFYWFEATSDNYVSSLETFLVWFIPMALIFYTIGWRNVKNKE